MMRKLAFIAAIVSALTLAGCTDNETANKLLFSQGYRDINLTGGRFFSWCEKGDFVTEFNATSPVGQHVTGVVCSHWLWGRPAIRID